MDLASYLARADERFDVDWGLVGEAAHTPGYHTTIADGERVHPTRGNLDYALACLADGSPARVARASAVIDRVLGLQETDPYAATYGIWPWFADEPLSAMRPPDWNWADFCGARLASMLAHHGDLLPAALLDRMRVALGHAGWSIFRRNVQPGYTNIALMGAAVTLAAGELLAEPRLVDYGRSRLQHFVDHTAWHGGLNEYNSPTYTRVALNEVERLLELVRDPAARELAEGLRRQIWESIAEHFHPATAQWAGPHSRCYHDRLEPAALEWLAAQAGLPLDPPAAADRYALEAELPCPADLQPRFRELPGAELPIVRRFIRREPDERSTVGTTWLGADACLGTVNHDTLWVQRRPALGYWVTAAEPAVLRVRALRDGRDFASGALWAVQHGAQALLRLGYVANQGDHHCHLDRPADGFFSASLLSFAFDLQAADATVLPLDQGWALRAGDWQAVVQPVAGTFEGQSVTWTCSQHDGLARCEVHLLAGAATRFGWERLRTARLGCALTLQPLTAPPPLPPRRGGDALVWDPVGLRLDWPE
ncbi:MAG: hypothetical protein IT204_21595 [Fimbriimonadaceae bacterium]|nr:hypothetical protein [Fimbriimonadaceae bacterium]